MYSSKTTLKDMELIRAALYEKFTKPELAPVSVKLNGKKLTGMPGASVRRRIIDANIVERTFTLPLPEAGLVMTAECFEYKDFPVFEWTVWMENSGSGNSAVISDFMGIDTELPTEGKVSLFHNNGDYCNRDGLETTELVMNDGDTFGAHPVNGRSCDRAWPYYRLTCDGFGYNIAVGWPGNWESGFVKKSGSVQVCAKQQYCNTYLKPGEKIRTPRMLVMAFEGDSDRGINVWRRYYFAHMLCVTGGHKLKPLTCFSYGGGGEEFTLATEENQINAIEEYTRKGAKPDLWWIDAGWYPCYDEQGVKRWVRTGTWKPDPAKFPNGLGPIGKKCAELGIEFLLWFEPERVMLKYWPEENPDEYVLKLLTPANNDWLDSNGLLYLGNPECRKWLTELVEKTLKDGAVTIYRQDFNGDPFPLQWWLQNDIEETRSGITENLHIQGYLQYWDDLLNDVPNLWIDSCASGGRRNDLEAMRRAVPLHPTDYGYGEHPVKQAFQKTWYEWTPYFRSIACSWDKEDGEYTGGWVGVHGHDSYSMHCAFAPVTTFGAEYNASEERMKACVELSRLEKKAAEYTLGSDFFCLTPVRKSNKDFFAIQFSREDSDDGLIQVIRNTKCEEETVTVFPKAIEDGAIYEFASPEENRTFVMRGETVNAQGIVFTVPKRDGRFWFYKKVTK